MYELVNEPLYLISTAEIPVTNLYRRDPDKAMLPGRHVAMPLVPEEKRVHGVAMYVD